MKDNRDIFVLIVCTISMLLGIIGVIVTHNINKDYVTIFVAGFNALFILFWIIIIVIEKRCKGLHIWLNKERNSD